MHAESDVHVKYEQNILLLQDNKQKKTIDSELQNLVHRKISHI